MEIYKKLFKLKSEIGKISKDSTNPFFKSKYFDINKLLEHLEPLLSKHGLLVLQPILEGKVRSEIIDPDTGEMVYSELDLGNITDPQKKGSEITYFRRYTLSSLVGLQAEDDDGNKASKQVVKNEAIELPWLTRMNGKEISQNWKRVLSTLRAGKDMNYIESKFKITKENKQLLLIESKKE